MLIVSLFVLIFVQVQFIESNYSVLQRNINFVQYPESLNYYFLKITLLTWILLEEDMGLITYSQFAN
jgi:hypothetical protein